MHIRTMHTKNGAGTHSLRLGIIMKMKSSNYTVQCLVLEDSTKENKGCVLYFVINPMSQ